MFDNIVNIYKDKVVTKVDQFDIDNYYYFYNEHGKIFGIKRDLSISEYQLLKSIYLEKTFYYNDQVTERFHQYIFEGKSFPFEKFHRGRFFVIDTLQSDVNEQLLNLLKDILGEIVILKMNQFQIVFYFDHFDYELKELFNTFSDDLGTDINLHMGPYFQDTTKGEVIAKYIYTYSSLAVLHKQHSTFVDLLMVLPKELFFDVIKIIKEMVLNNIDQDLINLMKEFFRNNLNVSLTAKLNYLHRNSLINKLDFIYKQTGLNIQVFHEAWAMNLLINVKA